MNIHKNARLTPIGRERLVAAADAKAAARAAGVCPRTVYKWVARFKAEGAPGLAPAPAAAADEPGLCERDHRAAPPASVEQAHRQGNRRQAVHLHPLPRQWRSIRSPLSRSLTSPPDRIPCPNPETHQKFRHNSRRDRLRYARLTCLRTNSSRYRRETGSRQGNPPLRRVWWFSGATQQYARYSDAE